MPFLYFLLSFFGFLAVLAAVFHKPFHYVPPMLDRDDYDAASAYDDQGDN